ncbi:hypothetical protein EDE05_106185 [Neorhizobium sp. R1-B]|jgi:hypothetical protein|nr:hypothetical protein EDE09_1315 [Neorhizobium sp. S3-V5DH]TDX83776.1 hypothetical protein EDE05_106185 [Neorhizobium sp. R1-B]
MAKNAIIGVLVVLIVALIAAFLMRGPSTPSDETPPPATAPNTG